MKLPSKDLFDLIHSLNKTEKRFINLEMGNSNQEINRILFQAISKQKTHQEEALKFNVQNAKIIKNLPFHKSNLYRQILRLLRKYRISTNEKLKLSEQVEFLNILKEKRLYSKLGKEIKRLEKLCNKHGFFDLLLNVLNHKSQHIIETQERGVIQSIEENLANEHYCLDRITTNINLNALDKSLFANNKASFEKKQKLKAILQKNKIQLINPITFNEHHQYNCIQCQIAWSNDKPLDYYKWRKKNYLLWENDYKKAIEKPFTHISVIINYLDSCRVNRISDEFFSTLKQLRKFKSPRADVQQRIFFFSNNLELLWFIHQQEFEKGIIIYKKIKRLTKNYNIKATNNASLLCNAAICHVQAGQFKKAETILQEMSSLEMGDMRKDLKAIQHILLLLCFFKLKKTISEIEKQSKKTQEMITLYLKKDSDFIEIINNLFFSKKKEHYKKKLIKYIDNNTKLFVHFDAKLWLKKELEGGFSRYSHI